MLASLRVPTIRVLVVFLALAILYLRMPPYFTNPQLFTEDAFFFFRPHVFGRTSLAITQAGYFVSIQALVALFASFIDPVFSPAIFTYFSMLVALLTVWLVTSPRLDMPAKALLALAVILVPTGQEPLGMLVDVQWILPIGAFVILFFRAGSKWTLIWEILFLALVATTGPFCLLFAPLYLARALTITEPTERQRLVILTAVVGACTAIQLFSLATHRLMPVIEASHYSWTLWINLPISKILTAFSVPPELFQGMTGAIVGLILLAGAVALSAIGPYRSQKLFMLLFGLGIALLGMLKFRVALDSQIITQRYFYVASVFSIWFLCCAFGNLYLRRAALASVAVLELMLVPAIANKPYYADDLQWPVWASFIKSGIPTITPTGPRGWFVALPANPKGPLFELTSTIGKTVAEASFRVDPSACSGTLDIVQSVAAIQIESMPDTSNLWTARGKITGDPARPLQLVLLANESDTIIGFGIPGLKSGSGAMAWQAFFRTDSGSAVHSYGLVDGRRLCRFTGVSYAKDYLPLTSDQHISVTVLTPNNEISQKFKPTKAFVGLSVKLVNFGGRPSPDALAWKVVATIDGHPTELGAGFIDPLEIIDWDDFHLPLSTPASQIPEEVEVKIGLAGSASPAAPVGIPLYRSIDPMTPATIAGVSAANGGQVGIKLAY